jgi:hypothetical protein
MEANMFIIQQGADVEPAAVLEYMTTAWTPQKESRSHTPYYTLPLPPRSRPVTSSNSNGLT